MPLGSLEDILSQVASYKAGADSATEKLGKIYQNIQEAQGSISIENSNNARDESVVAAAQQAAQLQTQARSAAVADAFNTDILKQGNEITSLAAQQKTLFEQKMESARVIAEKQKVGIFDDPLQYIMNQFTINDDIAEHNAANQQFNAIQTRISTLNQNTQSSIITQKALETGVTEASALAASRLAGAKSRIAATVSEITGLKYGAEGITSVLGASRDSLQASQAAYSAMTADEQIRMERRRMQMAEDAAVERKKEFDLRFQQTKDEFENRKKEFQYKADEREDDRAQGEYMIASINAGRAARGVTPLDPLQGKMAVRALMGKGGIIKDEWQGDYAAGQRIDSGIAGSISANPVDLVRRQASGSPLNLTPQQKPLLDITQDAINIVHAAQNPESIEAKKYKSLVGLDPKKDPESFKAAVNGVTQNLIKDQAAKVNYEDRNNIFNIPNLKTLAEHSEAIQALPVYQKVLKPVLDTGIDLSDPRKVFNLVGDAVANGTITHKQALEATTIYHVGTLVNAAQRNTMGVAGVAMPMQYNIEIDLAQGQLLSKKQIVNLADPNSFNRALIKSQAYRMGGFTVPDPLESSGNNMFKMPKPDIPSNTRPEFVNSTKGMGPKNTFLTGDRMDAADKAMLGR